MSFPTGNSGYGAPAPQSTPSAGSKGLPFVTTAVTAGLGVLNFLLGFMTFAKADGGSSSGPNSTINFFELGSSAQAALAFLLFGGVLAGLSLLPELESKAIAAAASVVGFLALLMAAINIPDGYSLAGGGYVVLILAFIQLAAAVVALLFDRGIITEPAPKADNVGGFGQPQQGQSQQGFGQGYPNQQGSYGQPQQSYPAQGQGSYGQPQQSFPAQGQQPYGAQPGQSQPQQPYGAPAQPQYGAQQAPQQPQSGYNYGAVPAQSGQQAETPAPQQYQPPVQGSTGPTYGSSLSYGATPNQPQHSAPESDPTQAFRAPNAEDDK